MILFFVQHKDHESFTCDLGINFEPTLCKRLWFNTSSGKNIYKNDVVPAGSSNFCSNLGVLYECPQASMSSHMKFLIDSSIEDTAQSSKFNGFHFQATCQQPTRPLSWGNVLISMLNYCLDMFSLRQDSVAQAFKLQNQVPTGYRELLTHCTSQPNRTWFGNTYVTMQTCSSEAHQETVGAWEFWYTLNCHPAVDMKFPMFNTYAVYLLILTQTCSYLLQDN